MIFTDSQGKEVDTRAIYQLDHDVSVDRIDNQDGTHCILVDHVQVGKPFAWDDVEIEYYVRRTVERLSREYNDDGRKLEEIVGADVVATVSIPTTG